MRSTAIAHVVVAKYADPTPHYRQAQMCARRGVVLDRSTLAHWTGSAAELLKPLRARLLEKLEASGSSSPTRPGRRFCCGATVGSLRASSGGAR